MLTGCYLLRANCYTPLPDANAVVLRSRDRDRGRLARARAEVARFIALHNFSAISRRGASARARPWWCAGCASGCGCGRGSGGRSSAGAHVRARQKLASLSLEGQGSGTDPFEQQTDDTEFPLIRTTEPMTFGGEDVTCQLHVGAKRNLVSKGRNPPIVGGPFRIARIKRKQDHRVLHRLGESRESARERPRCPRICPGNGSRCRLPASGRRTAVCQMARRPLECKKVLAMGRLGRKMKPFSLPKRKFSIMTPSGESKTETLVHNCLAVSAGRHRGRRGEEPAFR